MIASQHRFIKILPQEVISQIAAGEVIERPSSVVKELVENSLDAGAKEIRIEIEDGGKKIIKVSDDGCGISQEELLLAIERHATSKLQEVNDLFTISTLGFRGEALPSIAIVSKMEIRSRPTSQSLGALVRIEGGNILSQETVGMAPGTIITVSSLYFNLPARLKFLRSTATEEAHALDIVCKLALSYPEVRMQVTRKNKQLVIAPNNQDRLTRLLLLYPHLSSNNFIALNFANEYMKLEGFISKPEDAKSSKNATTLFVNGRVIRPGMLSQAVIEGYRHFIPSRVYPIVFLFLELRGNEVDINVHPTKAEVRFAKPQQVFSCVEEAIRTTLTEKLEEARPKFYFPDTSLDTSLQDKKSSSNLYLFEERSLYHTGNYCHETKELPQDLSLTLNANFNNTNLATSNNTNLTIKEEYNLQTYLTNKEACLVNENEAILIGELANTYLIFQDKQNIYLVDQHQAHERYNYETLKKKLKTNLHKKNHDNHDENNEVETVIQPLLFPISLPVSPSHFAIVEKNSSILESLGFQTEPFGNNTILLRSIPHGMDRLSNKDTLLSFLDDLQEYESIKEKSLVWDKIITSLACKSSIKAGDKLTNEEKTALWKQLMQTQNPYICPHGRPVMIKVTLNDLNRMFKRR